MNIHCKNDSVVVHITVYNLKYDIMDVTSMTKPYEGAEVK